MQSCVFRIELLMEAEPQIYWWVCRRSISDPECSFENFSPTVESQVKNLRKCSTTDSLLSPDLLPPVSHAFFIYLFIYCFLHYQPARISESFTSIQTGRSVL